MASRSLTVRCAFSSPLTSKRMCPLYIMIRRLPRRSASRMLWVIIRVVSCCSRTMLSVSPRTFSAVFGSRAAVCSSSSRSFGLAIVAIKRVSAWRWPPESRPTFDSRRSSRPSLSPARSSRKCSRSFEDELQRKVGRRPRRAAMARFSSIIMPAAVPIIGSWKTRPMNLARLCSGHFVMSVPAISMVPSSTG